MARSESIFCWPRAREDFDFTDFDFREETRIERCPAEAAEDVRLVFSEDGREALLCVATVRCAPLVPFFAVVEFVFGCVAEFGDGFAAVVLLDDVLVAGVWIRALAEAAVRHITTDAKIAT